MGFIWISGLLDKFSSPVYYFKLSTANLKFEKTPSNNIKEQIIFSKGVPSNCCTKPTDQSTTKSQHITVIPLRYFFIVILVIKYVKPTPTIEIKILIIDIGN